MARIPLLIILSIMGFLPHLVQAGQLSLMHKSHHLVEALDIANSNLTPHLQRIPQDILMVGRVDDFQEDRGAYCFAATQSDIEDADAPTLRWYDPFTVVAPANVCEARLYKPTVWEADVETQFGRVAGDVGEAGAFEPS